MSEPDPTCVGRVAGVAGTSVTVRLDSHLAGVAPLWRGQLQPIGQIGAMLVLPQGPIRLVASVNSLGIQEANGGDPIPTFQSGDRWLTAQLIGEIDSLGDFHRGVSTFPGLDDPVHFLEANALGSIYPPASDGRPTIGRLAGAQDVAVCLDLKPVVSRHCVVVGSTGSGKTSVVASLLQRVVAAGWPSANVVVIDPHGEYASALGSSAAVLSINSPGAGMLQVPYWALSAADILTALVGQTSNTVLSRFSELVAEARRGYAAKCDWISEASGITADTPVPFDLRDVWFRLDTDNRLVVETRPDGPPSVVEAGDARTLKRTVFHAWGAGSAAPFKGAEHGYYQSVPDQIRSRLLDPRFRFFLEPDASETSRDPFEDVLHSWLGRENPISVLDFAGAPTQAADVAIGSVLQLLFELSVRSTADRGVGRHRPVLVVIEEAHRFLADEASVRLARESVNRIAREGRKYGIGLMLVTQRPSELPDTAMSQAGTLIALRLTNPTDQARVRAALPDSVAGISGVFPSLRTGEAVIAGEAIPVPSRVLVDRPVPAPNASDPTLDGWRVTARSNDITDALAKWRGLDTNPGEVDG